MRTGTDTICRLATPAITSGVAFRDKHIEHFFQPLKLELQKLGASQYCQQVSHWCGVSWPEMYVLGGICGTPLSYFID